MTTINNQHANNFDYAVVIGRFQPVHNGHVAMLQTALETAAQVIVLVGSVYLPRTLKNPFSFEERQQLLLQALPKGAHKRVHIVPVEDYNDDKTWVAAVQQAAQETMRLSGKVPDKAKTVLVGHEKDSSSYYLKLFPNWHFHALDNIDGINATNVRHSYFSQPQAKKPTWQDNKLLPTSTQIFLQQFMQSDAYQQLCIEKPKSSRVFS